MSGSPQLNGLPAGEVAGLALTAGRARELLIDAYGALPRPSERASGPPPNARAAKHLRPSGPLRRRSFASSLAFGDLWAEQGCPPTARRGRAPLTANGRPRERIVFELTSIY